MAIASADEAVLKRIDATGGGSQLQPPAQGRAQIAPLQFRGRWKSMESSRRYIQMSRAMLAAQTVPQHLHELGAAASRLLLPLLKYCIVTVKPATSAQRSVSFASQL